MSDIIEIEAIMKVKRNAYSNLTNEEKNLKPGDRVQEANSSQEEEFIYKETNIDNVDNSYAWCTTSNGINRYFYIDAIKKSSKQIASELKEARLEKKRNKTKDSKLKKENKQRNNS